jgi:RNA polymerase primary sigma factor
MKQLKISQKLTDRTNETFKQYLAEIAQIKPFTNSEEIACATKAFAGDKQAQLDLVERNLRFVVSVAKQYSTDSIPLQDLVNEGNIGLIEASKRFDPNKGYKFISFAVWWIRKIILEHISNYGKIVRLPANKINNVAKLERQIHELEQKNGSKVDILEVINHYEKLDLSVNNDDEYQEFMFIDSLSGLSAESIDKPFGGEEEGTCLSDMLQGDLDRPTDYMMHEMNLKSEINAVLDELKPRDKKVIEALFGLNGNQPMTLKEVGDKPEFNISREMVRQIRAKALKKLEKNQRIKRAFEMMG